MHLSRSILTGIALVALGVTAAAAQTTSANSMKSSAKAMATGKAVTVALKAENGSGQSGTATLTQSGADVQVKIALKGGSSVAQPAHVHAGTCAKLGGVKYPLTNVTKGTSTTLIKGVTLKGLASGAYVINVHKSANDLADSVACGAIK